MTLTVKSRETGPPTVATVADGVAHGLAAALHARAPASVTTSRLVGVLAGRVAHTLGVDAGTKRLITLAGRLRDLGMIAMPDELLGRTGPLGPAEWESLNRHPAIGAEMLDAVPGLSAAAPLVRAHHERYDGEGYPDGLAEQAIPLGSRVIAVCDAFVAITSDRPHRRGVAVDAGLAHLRSASGSQFDPGVVEALLASLDHPRAIADRITPPGTDGSLEIAPGSPGTQRRGATDALRSFPPLPAFGPSVERAREIAATDDQPYLLATVESDIGLAVAVLRRASAAKAASVSAALAALTPEELRAALAEVPVVRFPGRSAFEWRLHETRIHAQMVVRATDRLAGVLSRRDHDLLLTAALLHDLGKLVIAGTGRELPAGTSQSLTAEQRVRREQRTRGVDHASSGGLLLARWGLPERLTGVVARHHRAVDAGDPATLVRLADTLVHYANGDAVDRPLLLRIAATCELSPSTLRDVMFDLPHAGGSQRQRAARSPLSPRETDVLRLLALGKRYKEIGAELGLSASTIRTHLHNTYGKLEVADRAQAVLKSTEHGWI